MRPEAVTKVTTAVASKELATGSPRFYLSTQRRARVVDRHLLLLEPGGGRGGAVQRVETGVLSLSESPSSDRRGAAKRNNSKLRHFKLFDLKTRKCRSYARTEEILQES
jgi:hypothetical protein